MRKNWLKNLFSRQRKKQHRVCRRCDQIIRKHERWHQVRESIVGIPTQFFAIEHRDCNDPKLEKAKAAQAVILPPPPIEQWLSENDLPLTTWIGTSASQETIQ